MRKYLNVRLAGVVILVIGLIIGLAALARSLNLPPGISLPLLSRPTSLPAADIDLRDEEQLVRAWIYENQPEMNPEVTFPLVEITTMDMRRQTQARVFKVTGETWLNEAFLIWEGQVHHLSTAFGDRGIEQLLVTDLDQNGALELVYNCHFGSGISSTIIAVFVLEGEGRLLETRLAGSLMNQLELTQPDAHTVLVRNTLRGGPGGTWLLQYSPGKLTLQPYK
jgi:hypothetical protein